MTYVSRIKQKFLKMHLKLKSRIGEYSLRPTPLLDFQNFSYHHAYSIQHFCPVPKEWFALAHLGSTHKSGTFQFILKETMAFILVKIFHVAWRRMHQLCSFLLYVIPATLEGSSALSQRNLLNRFLKNYLCSMQIEDRIILRQ